MGGAKLNVTLTVEPWIERKVERDVQVVQRDVEF